MASEVRITVTADDKSTVVLQGAGKNIEGIGKSARQASGGLDQMSRSAASVSNAIERGYSVLTRLDLVQISLQQSTDRVTDARKRYSDALKENGEGSTQAVQASRELESAEANLEKTQLRARLSYVLVAGDLLQIATRLPAVVSGLYATATASGAAAAGLTAVNIAGGAATVVLVGLAAATAAFQPKVETLTDSQEELAAAERAWREEANKPTLLGETFDEISGKLPFVTSQTELTAKALERYQEAQARVNAESSQNAAQKNAQDAAEAAKRTAEWERSVSSLGTSLGQAGIKLSGFSQQALTEMRATAAAGSQLAAVLDGELNKKVNETAAVEGLLANATGTTRDSLLDQAAAVVDKSGKHEVLDQLLKDGKITEEEYAAAVERSKGALQGQTQAANDASRALGKSSGGSSGGGAGSSTPFGLGGYADLAADALTSQSSIFKGTPGAAYVNEHQTLGNSTTGAFDRFVRQGANNPTVLDAYKEELQVLLSQNPNARANPAVAQYFNLLNGRGQYGKMPPGQLSQMSGLINRLRNQALPFLTAASGYHGSVNEPTLLLVGEAGRERVDVSPGGGSGGGLQMGGFTQILHVGSGADAASVASAARRGAAQGIQDAQRRRYGLRRSY